MNTKLILAIVKGGSCEKLLHHLLEAGFRVTELSSMGGFLRRSSTTLMIGVSADEVEEALAVVRQFCPPVPGADEHSATIFVLDADQLVQI